MTSPVLRCLAPLACAGVVWLASMTARADLEWLGLRLEGGGSYMLSEHQRVVLGYEAGFQGVARPYVTVFDPITIQLGVGGYGFPNGESVGGLLLVGGGLRIEPRISEVGRIYVDGDAYYARTGDFDRLALDVGVGFEFDVVPFFSLGPYLRYTHVLRADPNDGGDAMILSFGISLSVHGGQAGASDGDGDGVLDGADDCPRTHAGPSPDPERAGCPMEDADGDMIADRDDLCPSEPAGDTPDPERAGCPLADTDSDGVHDRDDLCPNEPAGDRPDAQRRGCPTPDSDEDGVYDPDDGCPTTHAGEFPDPSRAGCPDGDDDADTVRNAIDQCRAEPQGYFPDPDRPGCALPDQDGDRVPDAQDACPTRAGAPSQNPRRNGCPNNLVRLELDRIAIQRPVFFATNADRILPQSNAVLNAMVDVLLAVPQIRRISIEGHTDDVGEEEANLDLSNRRAANVMQWLIDHGVDASRLEAHGFGESRPLEEGTSRRARSTNRRVEFRVIDPAPSAPGLVEPIQVETEAP